MVQADTVFMSRPISINYNLRIRARIVSLDHEITMESTKSQFARGNFRIQREKNVVFGSRLTMRHRQFGYVEIVDVLPDGSANPLPTCPPRPIQAEETELSDWFDPTLVNLMYVCASTVQNENRQLAVDIADFQLNYNHDKKVSPTTFIGAQKFKKIQELGVDGRARNVPGYSLKTIKELAEVMYERMNLYWTTESIQNEQILSSQNEMKSIERDFQIIAIQQQQYFEMEQNILNEIFASTDNSWHWSFEHRNISDVTINNALENTGNTIIQLQENELKQMLSEAESSVEHMQEVVNKYQTQVNRYAEKAKSSMHVIKEFNTQLNDSTDALKAEIDHFEIALHDYIDEQLKKAVLSFFKAIFTLFTAALEEEIDPTAIIEGIEGILETMKELFELMNAIGGLLDTANGLNDDTLGEIAINPTTDFKDSLQSAIDMKLSGPKFDELKNIADNKLTQVNSETNHEIDGMDDLIMAYTRTSYLGKYLMDEVVNFAEVVLDWCERNDELAVAQNDLQKAVQQVENIQNALEALESTKNDYQNSMEQNQQDYQDALAELQKNYETMSTELKQEYLANITVKFEAYQEIFNDKKNEYMTEIQHGIDAVLSKSYGLKEASMTSRSMIMVLYQDYCDALFYHNFQDCSEQETPLMSDDFLVLLDKLNALKWDAIANADSLDPAPTQNTVTVIIEDLNNYTQPIAQLKNDSKVMINFKDFLPKDDFYGRWRWRVNNLEVYLWDENEDVIESLGIAFTERIQMQVTYPTIFNDTSEDKTIHTFLGQHQYCSSSYVTEGLF